MGSDGGIFWFARAPHAVRISLTARLGKEAIPPRILSDGPLLTIR
jgi:hypothetical protein